MQTYCVPEQRGMYIFKLQSPHIWARGLAETFLIEEGVSGVVNMVYVLPVSFNHIPLLIIISSEIYVFKIVTKGIKV